MSTDSVNMWFVCTLGCGITLQGVVFMDIGWDEIGVHLSVVGD